MSDRDLLEAAARAYWGDEIGDVCSVRWLDEDQAIGYTHADNQDHNGEDCEFVWNPLTDDGDEARLEATLDLDVVWDKYWVCVGGSLELYACHGGDKQAARRRAGVRAAAALTQPEGGA